MRLFIAEKPSLGRAIAEALPGAKKPEKTYIQCGEDIVAWAAGHVIELKNPEDYDPDLKAWKLETLPIVPDWAYKEKATTKDLLKTIKDLLKKAEVVVNAGDADREGQTLIDELLEFYKYKGKTFRLLVTDTNPEAVKKALAGMKDNSEYEPLYRAGQARGMSDWLLGMNMTRYYTVKAQQGGYRGTPISVGRVQTPLLGLIVRRDLEIENFKSKPFYTISAELAVEEGSFNATWKPGEGQSGLDEDGRLVDIAVADSIVKKVYGQTGKITKCETTKKKTAPPLPHSLPSLQIEASKKSGISPSDTLAIVQKLYEPGIVTYPRSDCPYLPEGHHENAKKVLEGVQANIGLENAINGANTALKSGAWNDKKVTEHHAIVPTGKKANLSGNEKAIYELIALRYVAQFWADFEYLETKIEASIVDELFATSGRQIVSPGWKNILTDDADEKEDKKQDEETKNELPKVTQGEASTAKKITRKDKNTTPPKRFTEASLLQAMNGIHRFVQNTEIKKMLQEADGLGTAATQAKIIETLFSRLYVEKSKKDVVSTEKGRKLIEALPEILTQPDLTALWEHQLKEIVSGGKKQDEFLAEVAKKIRELIESGKAVEIKIASEAPAGLPAKPTAKGKSHKCPTCKDGELRKIKGPKGDFWGCSNYRTGCRYTTNDKDGKPEKKQSSKKGA